jgi:hypothetical protein
LKAATVGCHIGQVFVGALRYAGDLSILAPSAGAMCRLLRKCSDYVTECAIKFNSSQSKYITFKPYPKLSNHVYQTFYLNNALIERIMS